MPAEISEAKGVGEQHLQWLGFSVPLPFMSIKTRMNYAKCEIMLIISICMIYAYHRNRLFLAWYWNWGGVQGEEHFEGLHLCAASIPLLETKIKKENQGQFH